MNAHVAIRPDADRLARANAVLNRPMHSQARGSVAAVRKHGARGFLREPWRLARLFGDRPIDGDLLHDCIIALGRTRKLGRQGHYAYDDNRLLALKQAHVALRWWRRAGWPEVL